MDQTNDDIFSALRQKVKQIIGRYEDQKAKAADLESKYTVLRSRVEKLEKELDDMNSKYNTLKMAKVLSSLPGEDVHETKIQVNRIVREIDKCIALLNR